MLYVNRYALSILLLCGGAAAASAQGLSDVPLTSVESTADAKDDRLVKLRGEIVRQVGAGEYLFRDGTGEIVVHIDDGLVQGRKLPAGTKLEIRGELEAQAFRKPRIEVGGVTLLTGGAVSPDSGRGHRAP
jgi:uncharacterized protein (TIGR00156 family)